MKSLLKIGYFTFLVVVIPLGALLADEGFFEIVATENGVTKHIEGKFDGYDQTAHKIYFYRRDNSRFFLPDNSLCETDRQSLERQFKVVLPGEHGVNDPLPAGSTHPEDIFGLPPENSASAPVPLSASNTPDTSTVLIVGYLILGLLFGIPLLMIFVAKSPLVKNIGKVALLFAGLFTLLMYMGGWGLVFKALCMIPAFMLLATIRWFQRRRENKVLAGLTPLKPEKTENENKKETLAMDPVKKSVLIAVAVFAFLLVFFMPYTVTTPRGATFKSSVTERCFILQTPPMIYQSCSYELSAKDILLYLLIAAGTGAATWALSGKRK